MGAVLPAGDVQKLVAEEVGPFRERIYPPLTTLGLFIGQALSQDGACQDAVSRRLSERVTRGVSFPRFFVFQPDGIMPPILSLADC